MYHPPQSISTIPLMAEASPYPYASRAPWGGLKINELKGTSLLFEQEVS
jgi:hypothetical protein